jgi:hypothetical protein
MSNARVPADNVGAKCQVFLREEALAIRRIWEKGTLSGDLYQRLPSLQDAQQWVDVIR